jgi:hypothetical protein
MAAGVVVARVFFVIGGVTVAIAVAVAVAVAMGGAVGFVFWHDDVDL